MPRPCAQMSGTVPGAERARLRHSLFPACDETYKLSSALANVFEFHAAT